MAPMHKIAPKLPRYGRHKGRNDKAKLVKMQQLFGDKPNAMIEELNETLAA